MTIPSGTDGLPRPRRGALARALDALERGGNRLPGPIVLLLVLWGLVLFASFVAARRGASATHPGTGANIAAVNLLSREGLRRLLVETPHSFIALPHVGPVLVVLLGLGVAERSGLLGAVLGRLGRSVPPRALTAGVVLAGILSSAFGDIGLILMPVLGACLFLANRRHPLAGAAAGFAGVTGGFGGNLLLGAVDPLLAASTESAARLADPARSVGVAANYWFAFASGLWLTAVGTFVNHRWVEPRLGTWEPADGGPAAVRGERRVTAPEGASEGAAPEGASPAGGGNGEARGLLFAWIALGLMVGVLVALAGPEKGLLRDGGGTLRPFFDALPVIVMALFLVPAAAHGHFAGTLRGGRALFAAATGTLAALGPYLLLALVAAQLMSAFEASNLGLLVTIKGARLFRWAHLSGIPLLVALVAAAAGADLLIPSASAKWALLAPVVVPLAMGAGHPPEAAQAAFRIGDSGANMMTPLLPFYPLFIAVVQRYARRARPERVLASAVRVSPWAEPRAGAGTLLALTLPYSIAFLVAWTGLLLAWVLAGLPFGPTAL